MKNGKPFSYKVFEQLYSKVPRFTVMIIVVKNSKILLAKRNLDSWRDMWHIPGVTVLYKESIAKAIERVALSELGIQVYPERLLGYIEYPSEQEQRGFGWTIGFVFQCEFISGIIKPNDDISDIQFFSSLPSTMISEEKEFVEKTLGDKFYSIRR